MDWLDSIGHAWLWLILGVVMAGAEMLIPGYFLIWLSIAAFLTGMIVAIADVDIAIQVLSFVVFSVFSVFAARRWFDYHGIETTDPLMNDRGGRLVGESVVVTQAFEGGQGRVRLGDSEWLARGADAPVGARLVVTGHDGAVLVVAPAEVTHMGGEPKVLSQD